MRYKTQIWDFYIKYTDEEKLMNYKKKIGSENVKAFLEMDDETFFRLLNTFSWLDNYNSPHLQVSEFVKKPTKHEFLEALAVIHVEAARLLKDSVKYPKGILRKHLQKKSKKRLECVEYYTKLVEENFFIK